MTNWNQRANEVEQRSQNTEVQRARRRAIAEASARILEAIGPLSVENLTRKREENRLNPGIYAVDDNWFYQQLRRLGATPDVPPDIEAITFTKDTVKQPVADETHPEVKDEKPVAEKEPSPPRVAKPAFQPKKKEGFLDKIKNKFNGLEEKTKDKVVVGLVIIVIVIAIAGLG